MSSRTTRVFWALLLAGCDGGGEVAAEDARLRTDATVELDAGADAADSDAQPPVDARPDGGEPPLADASPPTPDVPLPEPDAAPPVASCDADSQGAECVTDDYRWGRCAGDACEPVAPPADDPEVCDGGDTDPCADTWVVVDDLGRAVPGSSEVGPPQDRTVAMFYWTWHETSRGGPYDVSRILSENPDNPAWGPLHAPHHWGQPELGYYTSVDPYVYRKHVALLADAGVDVLVFDTTNSPFTWPEHYTVLCGVLDAMRAAGERTPRIAFLTPFWEPREVVSRLLRDVYGPGTCQAHWFEWDGRPLLLTDPELARDRQCDACTGGQGCDAACQGIGERSGECAHPGSQDPGVCCVCYGDRPPLRERFTFRKPIPGYFDGPTGPDQWPWLEVAPQHVFRDAGGAAEVMAVGVAQNATDRELKPMSLQVGIHGRSWHDGARDEGRPDAVRWGFNFQEQWDRALEVDPEAVFVTGWNEWVAGRFEEWQGVGGGAVFPDQYDHEYSRDIEPMQGGHGDDYYYQLMANVRRYRGARRLPRPSPPRPIPIGGGFAEWATVGPVYRDTVGDTAHRDGPGYGGLRYVETSGRNDIVEARVTWDADRLYFYVRTAAPLTPWDDPAWMGLLIDADHDRSDGWRGYEYIVTATGPNAVEVRRLQDAGVRAAGPLHVAGAELELSIPRAAVDQADAPPRFTFHWSDNVVNEEGETPPFGVLGDNAPNRRASYDYVAR